MPGGVPGPRGGEPYYPGGGVGRDDGGDMFITRDFGSDEPRMPFALAQEQEGPIRNVAPEAIVGASKSVLIGVGYLGTDYDIPENNKVCG